VRAGTSRLTPLAHRAGCTEGQLYTIAIGLVVAVLLAASGFPAAFRDALRPVIDVAGAEPSTTTVVAPSTPTPTSLVDLVTDQSSPFIDVDNPSLDGAPAAPTDAAEPPAAGDDEPLACDAQAALDLTDGLLRTLNVLGVLPDTSVTQLLAGLTGCTEDDPVILMIGVLAQLGSRLPDPGFDLPLIPLPSPDLPPGIIELVQPLRDAIDPICGVAASAGQVAFYGLAGWPLALDAITLQAINQVLLVCGQLQA
jgi:hypothetical protein